MPRPSRTRRILKWTGVGLSLLTLGAGVASLWCSFACVLRPQLGLFVYAGRAGFMTPNQKIADLSSVVRNRFSSQPFIVNEGFEWRLSKTTMYGWGSGQIHWYSVPLWLLAMLTTSPTAWMWHRDRRRIRPGCCLRCGYDLTGNTSGVCSECGLAKPPPATV